MFHSELADGLPELPERLAVTVGANLQRLAVIQTEHADKAFAVDAAPVVADQHPEGLHRCHGYKVLYILERVNFNAEFPHKFASSAVQSG